MASEAVSYHGYISIQLY